MKEKMRSLHIDLNEMTTQYQDVPESILKLYLGGRGLNAWWAQKLIKNKMDALSAENPLLISAGALTGTVALSSSRVQMTAISPLTSLLANSNVGGFWGVELIKKGIISLVITGRAETPVYISITDTGVVIRSAEEYWGMDTRQAADQIRQALHDEKGYIAVIGPAGERQVRSAEIGRASCRERV